MNRSRRWATLAWITGFLIVGGVAPCQTGAAQVARVNSRSAASPSGSSKMLTGQARRGQKQYVINCAMCHAEDLTGLDPAPALTGHPFMRKWQGKPLWDLFETIRKTMPQNDRGGLPPHTYLDIVTYLAKFNDIDIGTQELRDPALLKGVTIGKPNGHQPPHKP